MRITSLLMMVVSALLLVACGPNLQNIGKESDPTRFYTLSQTAQPAEGQKPMSSVHLMVRDVAVAEYLDRSHIVVRQSATQLKLADFDRWAATPDNDIQRVVAANLSVLLASDHVVTSAQKRIADNDYVLDMFVERFERNESGEAQITANWQLLDGMGRRAVASRRVTLKKPVGDDYTTITNALSELVGELSTHIAASIRQQP